MEEIESVSELILFLAECEKVYYNSIDGILYGWGPDGSPFEIDFIASPSLRLTDRQTGITIETNGDEVTIHRK
ncbi:MAG TPA: hypothetical protein P5225_00690 [Candidatus Paceibacterota bacterium]|jgi:hypothetical protein|nr:hypothetical protein [Candidatus Paceibacterota bacterium]